jgi:hypothetical protein
MYVIDRVCGTAPPDGGAALKRNAEALHKGDPLPTWGGEGHAGIEPEPEPVLVVTRSILTLLSTGIDQASPSIHPVDIAYSG